MKGNKLGYKEGICIEDKGRLLIHLTFREGYAKGNYQYLRYRLERKNHKYLINYLEVYGSKIIDYFILVSRASKEKSS